jgi:hypothetical protein
MEVELRISVYSYLYAIMRNVTDVYLDFLA